MSRGQASSAFIIRASPERYELFKELLPVRNGKIEIIESRPLTPEEFYYGVEQLRDFILYLQLRNPLNREQDGSIGIVPLPYYVGLPGGDQKKNLKVWIDFGRKNLEKK